MKTNPLLCFRECTAYSLRNFNDMISIFNELKFKKHHKPLLYSSIEKRKYDILYVFLVYNFSARALNTDFQTDS